MSFDFSNEEVAKRAEELIMRLGDVRSCRIATDEEGEITEIHVVAATERPPKLVAREVAASLSAEWGLDIDYRKIGVVIIDSLGEDNMDFDDPGNQGEEDVIDDEDLDMDKIVENKISEMSEGSGIESADSYSGEPEGSLELLEEDVRIRFKGLNVQLDESTVKVEVLLEKNAIRVSGYFEAFRGNGPFYKVVAEATLDAVIKLVDEDFNLCLSGIEQIKISEREAIVASVKVVDGRKVVYFSGTAFVERDGNEASALAVLDAVNRPFGRWKSRKRIHYRIR
ncbi:hypothetical protein J7M07_03125 [bacterium]|nr:hypothetical protein [bacterium]